MRYLEQKNSIQKWAEMLKIPQYISDEAIKLFDEYKSKGKFGYTLNKWNLAASCLLVASKTDPLCEPISLGDMVLPYTISQWDGEVLNKYTHLKMVAKYYRKIMMDREDKPQACTLNPLIYLDRVADKMGLSNQIREKAKSLYAEIKKKGYTGGGCIPLVMAAALLYVSEQLIYQYTLSDMLRGTITGNRPYHSQREFAEAVHCVDVTIRNYSWRIQSYLKRKE